MKTYHKSIRQEQDGQMRPALDRFEPVFLRHLFGAVPDGYGYTFNSLDEESKLETAQRQSTEAVRDKTYVDMGAISPKTVAKELKENKVYKTLEDSDVNQAKDFAAIEADKQAQAAEAQAKLAAKAPPPPV